MHVQYHHYTMPFWLSKQLCHTLGTQLQNRTIINRIYYADPASRKAQGSISHTIQDSESALIIHAVN
jgi:hypothetical protein